MALYDGSVWRSCPLSTGDVGAASTLAFNVRHSVEPAELIQRARVWNE
jgi:hypothetical protein